MGGSGSGFGFGGGWWRGTEIELEKEQKDIVIRLISFHTIPVSIHNNISLH